MNPSSLRAATAVAFALLSPAAFAGVAQVNPQLTRDIVAFQAPGQTEVNDLRVYFPNGKLAFYDDAGPVTAGAGCQQLSAKNASCTHKADHQTIVDLGPGNDELTAEAGDTSTSIFYGGGTGNDTLIGAPDGKETLSGNEGNDVIRPGKGSDELYGGSGVDTLDYSERGVRVVVNLAVKLGNGEPNENDKVMDFTIENLVTGAGNDELRGSSQPNKLTGKGGEDKYYGVGGSDTIYAREGVRDWIYCGDGSDTVYADFEDIVSGDCETVSKANPGFQGGGEFGAVDPGPGPLPPPPAPDPSDDDPGPADGSEQPTEGDSGASGSGEVTPPAATPGDTAAPALSKLAFAPKRFRIRRGTALRFELSEPAALLIRVRRVLPGRRTATGKCVAPTARLVERRAKRCSRTRARGKLGLLGAAGPNQSTFPTRVRGKALRPGRYRAILIAMDGARNTSKPVAAGFRVLRKKR